MNDMVDQSKNKRHKRIIVLVVLFVVITVMAVYLIYSFVTWRSDESGHWHILFGSHVGFAEHDFSLAESVEPTSDNHGHRDYKCNACGWTITEPITDHEYVDYECIICGKTEYGIGDFGPAGGYIFYDCDSDNDSGNADGLNSNECGWRFLEAAPADLRVIGRTPTVDSSAKWYSTVETRYVFGDYVLSYNGSTLYVNGTTTYDSSDCTGTAIGTGRRNTQLLVSAMGEKTYVLSASGTSMTDDYAARLCDLLTHTVNGVTYEDWFLPSKEELDLMYTQLYLNGFGGFAIDDYWSSSEYDRYSPYNAYSLKFEDNAYRGVYSRTNYFRIRPARAF